MHKRKPDSRSDSPQEKRLGEILLWLQTKKRQLNATKQDTEREQEPQRSEA